MKKKERMQEHTSLAMDVISETVKQRNCWRLAFCISLVGNAVLAVMLFKK